MTDLFGAFYGFALIGGGLLGYYRTASVISLVFGVVLGAWSVYNSIKINNQKRIANLVISILLGLVMLMRFFKSGKIFPALVVVGLSTIQALRSYTYLK